MRSANLDHIVVGASSLAQGVTWAQDVLGVTVPRGGAHAKMGTHNCVMRLDGEHYFEIIAINPDAPSPNRPRWFSLDNPTVQRSLEQSPQLLTWAVNTTDIQSAFTSLENAGYQRSVTIEPMSRDNLRWQVAFGEDGELIDCGLFPLVIEWDVPQHPAHGMVDLQCNVEHVEIISSQPGSIREKLIALGAHTALINRGVNAGERDQLRVTLKTPKGAVTLSSLNIGETE